MSPGRTVFAAITLAALVLVGCENATQPEVQTANAFGAPGPPINPGRPADPGPPEDPGSPDEPGPPEDPGQPTFCLAPPSGLVNWWPGDGDATDIIGGDDGELRNGASFATGQVDQAFLLDGADDFIFVALQPNTVQLTVDAWVMANAFNVIRGFADIVVLDASGSDGIDPNRNIIVDLFGDFERRFHVWPTNLASTTVLNVGQWYHVAYTHDGTTGKLYVNGVLEGAEDFPLRRTGESAVTTIGNWTGQNEFWDGFIDEVEVFSRALLAAEIQAIFDAGSAGKCKF